MKEPLLSINIVSYNTKDITLQCLRSIQKSVSFRWLTKDPTQDIEIVIVDNASTDGTQEAVRQLASDFPLEIHLIQNAENLGFGHGHNIASQQSRGEILLLLNTDTILLKDALANLTESYLSYNSVNLSQYANLVKRRDKTYKVHFAGPKLLNSNLTPQPSCGPYYSIPVIIGALFLKGDYWGLTRYSPDSPRQVEWISGACIMCLKEYFTELEGFDEEIFMYMEEIELLKRASKKGMQTWVFPEAQVVHMGSASSNTVFPIFQVYRGFLYLYRKHHTALELRVVQWLLALKARLAMFAGRVLGKKNLIETYTKALQIVWE